MLKLFFSALVYLILTISCFALDYAGAITMFEGNVDVMKGGKLPAVKVSAGLKLFDSDIVRTKTGGKVEIQFVAGQTVRLGERSRLDIKNYISEIDGKKIINLQRGKIFASVDPEINKGKQFEIHTPNACAGVRGTEYYVQHRDHVTNITVRRGKVYSYNLKHPNLIKDVSAGKTTFVSLGNPPTNPRPTSKHEIEQHRDDTDLNGAEDNGGNDDDSGGVGDGDQSGEDNNGSGEENVDDSGDNPEDNPSSDEPSADDPGLNENPEPVSDGSGTDPVAEVVVPVSDNSNVSLESTERLNTTLVLDLYYLDQSSINKFTTIKKDDFYHDIKTYTDSPAWGTSASAVTLHMDGVYDGFTYLGGNNRIYFDKITTSYSDGKIFGYVAGRYIDAIAASTNALSQQFVAIHLDSNNAGGILIGDMSGSINGLNTTTSGSVQLLTIQSNLADFNTFTDELVTSEVQEYAGITGAAPAYFNPTFTFGGTNLDTYGMGYWKYSEFHLEVDNSGWGVYTTLTGLSFDTGSYPPVNNWSSRFISDRQTDITDPTILETFTKGTAWESDPSLDEIITGKSYGYVLNIKDKNVLITAGEVIGTWNEVSGDAYAELTNSGVFLEVKRLMEMFDSDSDKLAALNFPVVEVGSVDLTVRVGGSTNFTSLTMMDVKFFTDQAGNRPVIWATDDVSGTYAATLVNGDNITLNNAAGTFKAYVEIKSFDTTNSQWSAIVNNLTAGDGVNKTVGTFTDINISGGAAGTIESGNIIKGTAGGIAY